MPNRNWKVISHSGQHMVLEFEGQRRDIPRPKDPEARKMFMSISPDQTIDDATIVHFLKIANWK